MDIQKKYTLLFNGKIYIMESGTVPVDTLLISGNRIRFAGRLTDINLPGDQVQRIDLDGRAVYPSFTDCHTHIAAVALYAERLKLDNCHSLAEALEHIARFVKNLQPGEWIVGGGWNANIWTSDLPGRADLDPVTPDNPVALYNKDGHTQWLNSLALKKCGLTENTPDPYGGRIDRDLHGRLTGLVYEKACEIVDRISDVTSYQQLTRCMDGLAPKLYRLGITAVHSCEALDKYDLFRKMRDRNELKIRICMQPPAADADTLIGQNLHSGDGDEWLRLGGLKYFMDGSLGSQTAEMFEPFTGTANSGIGVLSEAELFDRIQYASGHGLSATVHAIGDKANHHALNAFEKLADLVPQSRLRHRIEHAQILLPDDIKRFAGIGVTASMQPMHIADDIRIADQYLGGRTESTYALGSLYASRARLIFGSDMPVADPDPLKGILAAVTRRYQLDRNEPVWNSRECLLPVQALTAYTRNAAFASYEEDLKGTLAVNKLADIMVLSNDILRGSEDELYAAQVAMTIMDGRIVYRAF